VRIQQERDEQTVAIGTALGLLVVIVTAVGLVALLVHSQSDVLDGHGQAVFGSAFLIGGVVACTHLARSTRR
jgi:hypothetical protein